MSFIGILYIWIADGLQWHSNSVMEFDFPLSVKSFIDLQLQFLPRFFIRILYSIYQYSMYELYIHMDIVLVVPSFSLLSMHLPFSTAIFVGAWQTAGLTQSTSHSGHRYYICLTLDMTEILVKLSRTFVIWSAMLDPRQKKTEFNRKYFAQNAEARRREFCRWE